jgi:uncharacterized protein
MVTAKKSVKSLEEIKDIVSRHKSNLKRDYHVSSIGIFGSYARGQQKESSDIDILVEFEKPVGFFKFIHLENYLRDILGVKVDLVTRNALKPYMGKRILEEVRYL